MNAANLKKSARLQRVDEFLSDRRPHTTRDIIRGADVCAVNSCIAELRANGRQINGHWHEGKFYYRRVR